MDRLNGFVTGTLAVLTTALFIGQAQAAIVGHYKLDESGTATATPNSATAAPSGTNGTLVGYGFDADSGWRPGQAGNAIELDGTNNHVDIGNDGYDSFGQGTITAHINVHDFNEGGFGRAILASASDVSSNQWLRFAVDASGGNGFLKIDGQFSPDPNSGVQSATTTLSTNTWYHVAVTSNGSAWSLYIDGIAQTLTGTNTGIWFDYNDTAIEANSYAIGALLRSSGTLNRFDGLIDDVQIYDEALSAPDILLLSQHPGLSLEEAIAASIPEPSTGALAAIACAACLTRRRRVGRNKRSAVPA